MRPSPGNRRRHASARSQNAAVYPITNPTTSQGRLPTVANACVSAEWSTTQATVAPSKPITAAISPIRIHQVLRRQDMSLGDDTLRTAASEWLSI